jgi:hypothetical protein
MEMPQTHFHATVTVMLLWKCHKLIVMQQWLLRYYGNATGCIGQVTRENLIYKNIYFQAYSKLMKLWQIYNNATSLAWHMCYYIVGIYYTASRVNSDKLLFSPEAENDLHC